MDAPLDPLSGLLEGLAAPGLAPAGGTAAGVALELGIALFLKGLHNPRPVDPDEDRRASGPDLELLEALRQRVRRQLEAARKAEQGWARRRSPAARLAAYRARRSLLESALQALHRFGPLLVHVDTLLMPDLELAWRLVGACLEGCLAACEADLAVLPSDWVGGEKEALEAQARHGRELQARALSELAWRLRRV